MATFQTGEWRELQAFSLASVMNDTAKKQMNASSYSLRQPMTAVMISSSGRVGKRGRDMDGSANSLRHFSLRSWNTHTHKHTFEHINNFLAYYVSSFRWVLCCLDLFNYWIRSGILPLWEITERYSIKRILWILSQRNVYTHTLIKYLQGKQYSADPDAQPFEFQKSRIW